MNTARNEITALLQTEIESIERQLDTLTRALVGHNTVIEVSEGLYVRREGGTISVTGISHCSRWYPEDAAALCKDGNISDGAGNVGKPVKLHTALRTELQRAKDLLATVTARAAA